MKYDNCSKRDLIDIIEDLECSIEQLENDIDYEKSEVSDRESEIEELETECEELKEQLEEFIHLKDNLQKEIKYDYLVEYYDKITIEDLEKIIEGK